MITIADEREVNRVQLDHEGSQVSWVGMTLLGQITGPRACSTGA